MALYFHDQCQNDSKTQHVLSGKWWVFTDKWSVTHFCPGKGRFLRTKVYVFELGFPPDPEFYPWTILRCPRQTPDAITMNLQNRKPPYTTNAPHFHERHLAVRKGLEPSTPGVTGPYSNQLNYRTRSCCVCFSNADAKLRIKFEPASISAKNFNKFENKLF